MDPLLSCGSIQGKGEAAIPEIIEVEKLRRQLEPAWKGRKVVAFRAPPSSPNPTRKYPQDGWVVFSEALRSHRMVSLDRHGKHLWVQLEGDRAWHIHLNSTGWFMPRNDQAKAATKTDPIHENFLHPINDRHVRMYLILDDGQEWNYHDPRTWGKWWIKPFGRLLDDPYMRGLGPDWLKQPVEAAEALRESPAKKSLKDVLTDQTIAAGVGNYLACEVTHRAGIHPHEKYGKVTKTRRRALTIQIEAVLAECHKSSNHGHWRVFGREGETCPTCRFGKVQYAKDGSGNRGSYYCPTCQPRT